MVLQNYTFFSNLRPLLKTIFHGVPVFKIAVILIFCEGLEICKLYVFGVG